MVDRNIHEQLRYYFPFALVRRAFYLASLWQSTDSEIWEITGHGGSLHFEGTKVNVYVVNSDELLV